MTAFKRVMLLVTLTRTRGHPAWSAS